MPGFQDFLDMIRRMAQTAVAPGGIGIPGPVSQAVQNFQGASVPFSAGQPLGGPLAPPNYSFAPPLIPRGNVQAQGPTQQQSPIIVMPMLLSSGAMSGMRPTVGAIPRGAAQGQQQTGPRMSGAEVQAIIDRGQSSAPSQIQQMAAPAVGRAQQVAGDVGSFLSRAGSILGPAYGQAFMNVLGAPLQPLRYLLNPTFRGQVNQGVGQIGQALSPVLGGVGNAAADWMFGPAPAGGAMPQAQPATRSQPALPMVQQGAAPTTAPAPPQGGAVDLYTYSGQQLGERQTYRGRVYEWTGETWRKVRA